MRKLLALAVPALAMALLGCLVGQQSPGARAQEAASELNVNARFGRLEIATEHVAPKAKEQFMERRRAWGTKIRVADWEMAGVKLLQGSTDAEAFVRIAWYRIDQDDLRVTLIKQKWHDFKGSWKLVEETRQDGDIGLLGEPVVDVPPPTGARRAQFPTIKIGGQPPAEPSPPAEPTPSENP